MLGECGWTSEEQVLAANIDTVFLVSGLDGDFSPRRIERFLAAARQSGATPVILLNKSDLREDAEELAGDIARAAADVAVHAVSAATGGGLGDLEEYLTPGSTVALLGSSGVGKTTLVNVLSTGRARATRAVREDDSRGRHTTTARELVRLPGGAWLMDTPGLRELALWGEADGLSSAFVDIESLAGQCRFADCTHASEPGCAVLEAVESGALDPAHLENYHKLERELRHFRAKSESRVRQEERARWRPIIMAYRRSKKSKGR